MAELLGADPSSPDLEASVLAEGSPIWARRLVQALNAQQWSGKLDLNQRPPHSK